jgi:predicted Zn finger-like uncharacterized protein
MDVTCERCKTGYEFDDALVSERGTSVRCTTCGHTFKVRRPGASAASAQAAPGATKERWLVRTIDGRELEFRALRELQAAIAKGNVRRDDVLARENGRPRRLGSIAELDPFFSSRQQGPKDGTFSKTSIGVGPPRPRAHTPPGLGDSTPEVRAPSPSQLDESALRGSDPGVGRASMSSGTSEGSVAIPLAAVMGKNNPGSRRSDRPGQATRTPVPPITVVHGETVGFDGSGPPDDGDDITHQVSRKELEAKIREAESLATSESIAQSLPKPSTPPPPPPAGEPARRASLRDRTPPSAEDATTQPQVARAAAVKATLPSNATSPASGKTGNGTGKQPALDATTIDAAPPFEAEMASDDPGASGAHRGPSSNGGPASSGARLPELPPPPPAHAPTVPRSAEPTQTPTPTPADTPDRGSIADMRASMASLVNLTPTPADVRYSYVAEHTRSSGDARFSGASESRRVGSARWIFALLLLGAVVVGGAVVGRHYFSKDGDKVAGSSEKLAALLADAEKAIAAGDLDTAKELVDRASGLAEKDAKVARLSARIANERAELPWLELRFLAPDDASRQAVKTRLADQVGRAKTSATRAAEIAKTDPEILRERVDALRLAGELPAARALVPQLAGTSSEPRTQLVLAALDLAEDTPPLDEIVPRLSKVAGDDADGGRARLLLVYALGRKNDVERAKQELAKLRATHPLRASAEAFLERTAEGVAPSLDIESLPDAAPRGSSDAGVTGATGEVPADFRKALEQASQALAKGDQARAEQLYRGALTKEPGNPEALAGLGHVARARGNSKEAIDQYKKSLAGSGNYLPALVPLADMLWDSGDRFLAQVYYRQIAQVAPPGATLDRAKERGGSGGAPPPAAPPTTAPEAPTQTPSADPPPIELLKPDPPSPKEGE